MPYSLVHFRQELRLDLKDSGALWSDSELDRCVHRAVDDFSRFMPLERVHELTHDFTVTNEALTIGEDTDADQVVHDVNFATWVAGSTSTILASPDKPRRLTLTITDANTSVTSFCIRIEGTDQDDFAIEERFMFGGGLIQTGKKTFKTVTRVICESIAGNGVNDILDVGVGSINDVWHYLTYKPIKPESEVVTSNPVGTTYVRDTDYVMDYINGAIKIISGGSMAAAGSYLVSYTKSKLGVSLLDELPEYRQIFRITHVLYPADMRPQQKVSFNIWNDFLYVGSQKTGESQKEMTNSEHMVIYYEMAHSYPTPAAGGTVPDALFEVICTGASAYALLMMALKYEHQAVTDIAYVDDALDKIATEMTALDGELTAAAAVWTDELTAIQLVDSTLDDGASYLSDGVPFINAVNEGDNVPELYRDYGNVQAALAERYYLVARAWEQKRADLLTEAARYVDKADAWNGEAQNRITNAGLYLEIATRWRQEGLERRNEFWSILRDKSEYRKRISSTPVRQPA